MLFPQESKPVSYLQMAALHNSHVHSEQKQCSGVVGCKQKQDMTYNQGYVALRIINTGKVYSRASSLGARQGLALCRALLEVNLSRVWQGEQEQQEQQKQQERQQAVSRTQQPSLTNFPGRRRRRRQRRNSSGLASRTSLQSQGIRRSC